MFGAIVRAAAVFVAGSLIALALAQAGGQLADETQSQTDATSDSDFQGQWQWIDVVSTWWPIIPVATIAGIFIGHAIMRRGQTRI
jgi:hypothetical protein